MHNTSAINSAGKLKSPTTLAASTSSSTEAPIFTVAQNRPLTAPVAGDIRASGPVVPRASSTAGITTTTAPYNADRATLREPLNSQASAAITMPKPAWASTTRQGDSTGGRPRQSSASARVNLLKGRSSASSS